MNKRISDLPAISTVDTSVDPIPIVDTSDVSQAASGTTKRITINQISTAIKATDPSIYSGTTVNPNGVVTAPTGSIYFDISNPATPVQWVRTSTAWEPYYDYNQLANTIVVDNVAALKALTVASLSNGQVILTRGYYTTNDGGQGAYTYNSSSAASDNGGTVIAPSAGSGRFLLQYSDVLNVKQFGAKGDNSADDTSEIQTAVTLAGSSGSNTSIVFFPCGVYKTSAPIVVSNNNIEIRGEASKGALSYSPLTIGGSHIAYSANDGGDIIRVGTTSAIYYGITIRHIRVGAAVGLSVKPAAGIRLNTCSEGEIDDVVINGACQNGIVYDACSLITTKYLRSSVNDVGILFANNTSVVGVPGNKELWFSNLNIWDNDDGLLITGASSDLNFSDSWIEFSDRAIHFRQDASADLYISNIQFDNVYCSTGGGGPSNSRSIKGTAKAGASQSMRVSFKARNCTFYNNASTYNVEYIKGTNTGVNTYLEEAQFDNCSFIGASTSAVYSDTGNSTSAFTNKSVAYNTFGGSLIPLSSGLLKPISILSAFGYWNMSESYPILLPRIGSFTYAIDGQFYYENTVKRLASTSNGVRIVHSRPYVETFGDQSITATVAASGETLMFNTALTATRTVTLSSTAVYNGAKFRVVRTAAATGAFDLNVAAGLKLLAAGQWCDVEHNGTQWVLTAYGTL